MTYAHTISIFPSRAYETLEPLFRDYIADQHLFDGEQGCRTLLDFLDPEFRDQERLKFRDADADGVSHWNEFKKNVTAYQAIMVSEMHMTQSVSCVVLPIAQVLRMFAQHMRSLSSTCYHLLFTRQSVSCTTYDKPLSSMIPSVFSHLDNHMC